MLVAILNELYYLIPDVSTGPLNGFRAMNDDCQSASDMDKSRGMASDACMTVQGDCPMHCEVVGSQIEFRFGNEQSGMHLFMDGESLGTWLGLVALMAERIKAVPPGMRADFVVRDVDIDKSTWPEP